MTCLSCNLLAAKEVDSDIVMYTYAKYHQAEESMQYAIYSKNDKDTFYNIGKMDALVDMLRFYEHLDEHNRSWSE
jgi:hypothetical protein